MCILGCFLENHNKNLPHGIEFLGGLVGPAICHLLILYVCQHDGLTTSELPSDEAYARTIREPFV